MALEDFGDLKTSVADWLNRSDLTTVIPDFITLCEAQMKRKLRRTTRRETVEIDTAANFLPCTAAELRALYIVDSGSASKDGPISIGTPEMVAEKRAQWSNATGRPQVAAITSSGRELLVAPTPDQTYDVEMLYFAQLQPLSTDNTINDELREAPDAYLFGTLLQAAPYLEHDERIPLWQAKFDAAIEELNQVREREEFGASLKPFRLPVTFG